MSVAWTEVVYHRRATSGPPRASVLDDRDIGGRTAQISKHAGWDVGENRTPLTDAADLKGSCDGSSPRRIHERTFRGDQPYVRFHAEFIRHRTD